MGRIGLGQPSMVWVWIWKISPKNANFLIFFSLGQKKISLVWVKGRLASFFCGSKES